MKLVDDGDKGNGFQFFWSFFQYEKKKKILSLSVSLWLCGNVGESVCLYVCVRVYACVRAREHLSVCEYLSRLLCV